MMMMMTMMMTLAENESSTLTVVLMIDEKQDLNACTEIEIGWKGERIKRSMWFKLIKLLQEIAGSEREVCRAVILFFTDRRPSPYTSHGQKSTRSIHMTMNLLHTYTCNY